MIKLHFNHEAKQLPENFKVTSERLMQLTLQTTSILRTAPTLTQALAAIALLCDSNLELVFCTLLVGHLVGHHIFANPTDSTKSVEDTQPTPIANPVE